MMIDLKLANTQQRLREWGYWYDYILSKGLKYSSQSMEQRTLSRGTGELTYPDNPDAEVINVLVNQLANVEPIKARILRIHYRSHDDNFADKIKKMQLSRSTYSRCLLNAEQWIHQKLNRQR